MRLNEPFAVLAGPREPKEADMGIKASACANGCQATKPSLMSKELSFYHRVMTELGADKSLLMFRVALNHPLGGVSRQSASSSKPIFSARHSALTCPMDSSGWLSPLSQTRIACSEIASSLIVN